jgi:hypothetical protein
LVKRTGGNPINAGGKSNLTYRGVAFKGMSANGGYLVAGFSKGNRGLNGKVRLILGRCVVYAHDSGLIVFAAVHQSVYWYAMSRPGLPCPGQAKNERRKHAVFSHIVVVLVCTCIRVGCCDGIFLSNASINFHKYSILVEKELTPWFS